MGSITSGTSGEFGLVARRRGFMANRSELTSRRRAWLLRAVAPLFLVLFGTLGAAAPAFAGARISAATCTYGPCGGNATITVSVQQDCNGVVTLAVDGHGFAASETVDLTASNPTQLVGVTTANPGGVIKTTIVLPGGYSAGTHTLTAVGTVSGRTASATFTLARTSVASTPGLPPCKGKGSSGQVTTGATTATTADPPAVAASSSGLAFTGADAGLTAGLGALVVCSGGLLVIAARRRRSRS
jgi:hypothetical protein